MPVGVVAVSLSTLSKKYSYSDLPVKVPVEAYDEAKKRFVAYFAGVSGLTSIYSFGSVSDPGISDIDLLLVFEDEMMCKTDFRRQMSAEDRYLFIHAPYATGKSLLFEGQRFTFFRPYHLVHGDDVFFGMNFKEADPLVRHQVALEYLLRLYFSLQMQNAYRLLRVRSILLNAKGSFIDILHLAPSDLQALSLNGQLRQLRTEWFAGKKPPLNDFTLWFESFFTWFTSFLEEQMRRGVMYLPQDRIYTIARNLTFSKSTSLAIDAKVTRMALLKPVLGRKYFNFLNRLSSFHVTLPFQNENIPEPLSAYFNYNTRQRTHNRLHLPHCLPFTNSLHLK